MSLSLSDLSKNKFKCLPGRDDSALVETSGEIDNDFATSVIVDDLELADVAVLHHDGQETGDHLRRGAEQDLRSLM